MHLMEIEDFFKIIVDRRSCREFKNDPVPDKDLQQIIEAARWAPSSANSQPWDIIVVKNPETKILIQESVKRVITKIKEFAASAHRRKPAALLCESCPVWATALFTGPAPEIR